MDGGAADEREPREDLGPQEMASPSIPDELLLDIFRRIPDPADLVRVSAACVSFRRLVGDRSFLRLYRKLHAPPLLGFLDRRRVFHPAMAPHPSASAASAVTLAADFSFSFLPAPARNWILKDIRDGRVLLDRAPQHVIHKRHCVVFPELVVCDPLHQRYILLPPIPGNLTAAVERPLQITQFRYCEIFLAPSRDEDETSFSVIWMAQCETRLAAFIFSSSTAQWRSVSSQSWDDLFAGLISQTELRLFTCRQHAYSCFYWVSGEWLLVLDTQKMEFSIAESPPEARSLDLDLLGGAIAIVEAGEGTIGMFVRPDSEDYLNYTIRRNSRGSASQWQFEKTISLDSGYSFMGSRGKHLFLYQCQSRSHDAGCFSLDAKTFQLERLFASNSCNPPMYAYINFATSLLSTPTISSGSEKGLEKEMLEQGRAASSKAQSPLPE